MNPFSDPKNRIVCNQLEPVDLNGNCQEQKDCYHRFEINVSTVPEVPKGVHAGAGLLCFSFAPGMNELYVLLGKEQDYTVSECVDYEWRREHLDYQKQHMSSSCTLQNQFPNDYDATQMTTLTPVVVNHTLHTDHFRLLIQPDTTNTNDTNVQVSSVNERCDETTPICATQQKTTNNLCVSNTIPMMSDTRRYSMHRPKKHKDMNDTAAGVSLSNHLSCSDSNGITDSSNNSSNNNASNIGSNNKTTTRQWSDLGGGTVQGESVIDTAVREFMEESLGIFETSYVSNHSFTTSLSHQEYTTKRNMLKDALKQGDYLLRVTTCAAHHSSSHSFVTSRTNDKSHDNTVSSTCCCTLAEDTTLNKMPNKIDQEENKNGDMSGTIDMFSCPRVYTTFIKNIPWQPHLCDQFDKMCKRLKQVAIHARMFQRYLYHWLAIHTTTCKNYSNLLQHGEIHSLSPFVTRAATTNVSMCNLYDEPMNDTYSPWPLPGTLCRLQTYKDAIFYCRYQRIRKIDQSCIVWQVNVSHLMIAENDTDNKTACIDDNQKADNNESLYRNRFLGSFDHVLVWSSPDTDSRAWIQQHESCCDCFTNDAPQAFALPFLSSQEPLSWQQNESIVLKHNHIHCVQNLASLVSSESSCYHLYNDYNKNVSRNALYSYKMFCYKQALLHYCKMNVQFHALSPKWQLHPAVSRFRFSTRADMLYTSLSTTAATTTVNPLLMCHRDVVTLQVIDVRDEYLEKQSLRYWNISCLRYMLNNGGRVRKEMFRHGAIAILALFIDWIERNEFLKRYLQDDGGSDHTPRQCQHSVSSVSSFKHDKKPHQSPCHTLTALTYMRRKSNAKHPSRRIVKSTTRNHVISAHLSQTPDSFCSRNHNLPDEFAILHQPHKQYQRQNRVDSHNPHRLDDSSISSAIIVSTMNNPFSFIQSMHSLPNPMPPLSPSFVRECYQHCDNSWSKNDAHETSVMQKYYDCVKSTITACANNAWYRQFGQVKCVYEKPTLSSSHTCSRIPSTRVDSDSAKNNEDNDDPLMMSSYIAYPTNTVSVQVPIQEIDKIEKLDAVYQIKQRQDFIVRLSLLE